MQPSFLYSPVIYTIFISVQCQRVACILADHLTQLLPQLPAFKGSEAFASCTSRRLAIVTSKKENPPAAAAADGFILSESWASYLMTHMSSHLPTNLAWPPLPSHTGLLS